MGDRQATRVMVPKGPRATAARAQEWIARPSDPTLPDWLRLQDHQLDAVERVVKEYEAGARVVFLDAPTGTGKTAIAELVRRRLDVRRGLYVCTTKSLQEQVARDFTYARVLKGRANYTPTKVSVRAHGGPRDALTVTCGDCDAGPVGAPLDEQSCSYCWAVDECPYKTARGEAERAAVGVLNTAFLLSHLNAGRNDVNSEFAKRDLVVADECDLLEDELLGYVEVRVGRRMLDRLGLEVPKKGSHMTTIRSWLEDQVAPGLDTLGKSVKGDSLEGRRDRRRIEQLANDVARVLGREEGWVRDGDEEGDRSGDALVLKPVSVEDVGDKYLWSHGERWLAMSGTVVSALTMADSLGLETADIPWSVVEMPMRFAKENRRVVYAPVATMTRKGQEDGTAIVKMLTAVDRVLERHPRDNVLIHTHTYKLAREVADHLRHGKGNGTVDGRTVITYADSRNRDVALDSFKRCAGKGGAVMVAPSMDRGIDLPGDLCRVQVIVKVPMASLGSRQVSERLRTPGGDAWYLANTCRTVMQACGRAVRGMDDHAVTYMLDAHFSKILGDGKRRGMFPQWWLDALEFGRPSEYA